MDIPLGQALPLDGGGSLGHSHKEAGQSFRTQQLMTGIVWGAIGESLWVYQYPLHFKVSMMCWGGG